MVPQGALIQGDMSGKMLASHSLPCLVYDPSLSKLGDLPRPPICCKKTNGILPFVNDIIKLTFLKMHAGGPL